MTRRRWRITILAALATLAAVYPITSLFVSSGWFPQAAVLVALVAVVGVVCRGLTRSRLLIVLSQVVILGYVLIARFAEGTMAYLLPTLDTFQLLGTHGAQAIDTIQRYTAPAPLNTGVTFCLLVAVVLVAIAVDAMAATWGSPAAAGLPLLTAYLITAANGNEALQLRYFVAPVALWLVMLHTTAQAQFGRWSTTSATSDAGTPGATGGIGPGGHDGAGASGGQGGYGGSTALGESDGAGSMADEDRRAQWSFTLSAVRIGILGIVIAALLPVVVPHVAPRYLTDGLGRRAAGGEGTVGFNDTIDLTKSLNNTDQTPVLRYTTTGLGRSPLRVLATSYYSRGQWLVVGGRDSGREQPAALPPQDMRKDYVMTVSNNTLEAPRVAAPYPVVAIAMDGITWSIDPVTRDVRVNSTPPNYRVTFADVSPTPPALRAAPSDPTGPDVREEDLALPDTSRDLLETWSAQVTRGKSNHLDKAIAIQDHLRDTSIYTYSLDLGPQPRDAQGRPLEAMQAFYETKRGYCVQFATAMILLARAQGIPARMAIGFLPGSADGSENVVRAADAHAWPELYFQGFGWLRFEPTPGSRSGPPPPYTVIGSTPGAGGGRAPSESVPTGTATATVTRPGDQVPGSTAADDSPSLGHYFTGPRLVIVIAVLVGLLAAFMMPLTAWLARVRRRRAAVSQRDLIEVEWEELTTHLRDLGLAPPPGGTLRQWREHYIREGHLDADTATAMRRVTATLESARYDRPERTSSDSAAALHRDIRSVRRRISRTRAWTTRLASFVWPSSAVSAWRRLPDRLRRR